MNIGTIAHLFKHEFRMDIRRMYARTWFWAYAAVILAVLLVALGVWGGRSGFNPQYLIYFMYAFPFFMIGVGHRALNREWSDQTYGWWLTLPYSRFRLLLAKFAASLVQGMILGVIAFGVLLVLVLYTSLLHGKGLGEVADFVQIELQYMLVTAAAVPFMTALGMAAAIIWRSKAKGLLPLIWIVFGTLGNIFNWINLYTRPEKSESTVLLFQHGIPPEVWAVLAGMWLLAGGLFAVAVYICKKHLIV
ncbi:ABC transporter permease [Cohnella laeviribosi]|uniref:ABC transporter permease n=1 Tax=Cohnella laeviribosi TaxID=380174 RepID=UPI003D22B365